jgi:alkaline phosphatase
MSLLSSLGRVYLYALVQCVCAAKSTRMGVVVSFRPLVAGASTRSNERKRPRNKTLSLVDGFAVSKTTKALVMCAQVTAASLSHSTATATTRQDQLCMIDAHSSRSNKRDSSKQTSTIVGINVRTTRSSCRLFACRCAMTCWQTFIRCSRDERLQVGRNPTDNR